ncbi:MAG: hypothetical protein ACI4F5_06280 [Acutalibacteraceae bacterium]
MNDFPKLDISKMPKSTKEHLAAGLSDYLEKLWNDPVRNAEFEKFAKEHKKK